MKTLTSQFSLTKKRLPEWAVMAIACLASGFLVPDNSYASDIPPTRSAVAAITQLAAFPASPHQAVQAVALSAYVSETSPQLLAQTFVSNLNAARVSLALSERDLASGYLKRASAALKEITATRSPSVVMHAGPLPLKLLGKGSFWMPSTMAVTDAGIAYLTLDLSSAADAQESIRQAQIALFEHDFQASEAYLAPLMRGIVQVEAAVSVPLEKAQDNLVLSNAFLDAKNYRAARFALNHAETTLQDLKDDPRYDAQQGMIQEMRADADYLRQSIDEQAPSLPTRIHVKMDKWRQAVIAWMNS